MCQVANKEMIIVGGPNGAGKSTFAEVLAAQDQLPYLSADAIAAELSPENPSSRKVLAGRVFLHRVDEAIAFGQSFIIESTLSGVTFRHRIAAAREAGFGIVIVYLFLDSAISCVERVSQRVQKGGHFVPEIEIRRRFRRSAANFWNCYRALADRWTLLDNSGLETLEVAEGTSDRHAIRDSQRFSSFLVQAEAERE